MPKAKNRMLLWLWQSRSTENVFSDAVNQWLQLKSANTECCL